jgi:hypothetical protein
MNTVVEQQRQRQNDDRNGEEQVTQHRDTDYESGDGDDNEIK